MLAGLSRQTLAAMVPKQLWLGKNPWHVSCRPPQGMIHGVLQNCFVLEPKGQFVGGPPVRLHAGQCPSSLTPPLLSWVTSALNYPSSGGEKRLAPNELWLWGQVGLGEVETGHGSLTWVTTATGA